MSRIDTILRVVNRFTRPMRQAVNVTRTMETQSQRTETAVNRMENRMNRVSFGGFSSAVITLNQGLDLVRRGMMAISQVTGIIDNYTLTTARIDLMNDGLQTTKELQEKIFAAAQRSRGAYSDMASSVAKMGLLANQAFKNNSELVGFTELVQKSFKIGGASTQEQQAGMYQLTQAMASGRLQGDEFRSIMENAPMIAEAIAKATGKSKGDLKEMSREGTITADIIKKAMFMASDDIEKKFKTMPKTFGDVMTNIKNIATWYFGKSMETIIEYLNSPRVVSALGVLERLIESIGNNVLWLLYKARAFHNFITTNWTTIEPIVWGIAGAIVGGLIPSILLMIVKMYILLKTTLGTAAAWLLLHWPVLLFGILVAGAIYIMLRFGDTVVKVVGRVGGIFGVLFGFLYNKFAFFANIILSVAEFFMNVWKNPVYATKKLFFDLSISVLEYMKNMAKGIEDIINKIPGVQVNITGGMDKMLGALKTTRGKLKSDKDVVELMRFKQMGYDTAFKKGQNIGEQMGRDAVNKVQGVANKIGDMFKGVKDATDSKYKDKGNGIGDIDKIGTIDTVNKIKDDVNIAQEDIKLMRELAEQKAIQNFVTLIPTVNNKIGTIRENADADRLLGQITEKLITEVSDSAKGVYA